MCYSAEASFTAAAALTVAGLFTLKLTKEKRLIALALVPLFFAFQQLNEGILWLYLPTEPKSLFTIVGESVFMFFAYFYWPIYIPLALFIAEKHTTRKKLIALTLIAGILQTLYFILGGTEDGAKVGIINHSIQYLPDSGPFRWIYTIIIVTPCMISSVRGIKLFGALIFLAVVVTEYFYRLNFVSVWCFFSALISLMIYWIVRQEQKVSSQ